MISKEDETNKKRGKREKALRDNLRKRKIKEKEQSQVRKNDDENSPNTNSTQ